MSGLSLDGTGLAAVMPSTVNTYVPGLTLSRGLTIVDAVGQLNPSSGLVLRGSGLSFGLTAGAPLDATVSAWAAAVVVNGGTVSLPRAILVNTLITAWIAAGVWDLIDDAWLLVAENAPQALTSLKQRRLATATAAPTFTVDRGYAFNGTAQYLDTGFIPNTNKVAMTGTNMHLAVYERTNVNAATAAAGCLNFSTQNLMIIPRTAGIMTVGCNNSSTGGTPTSITDSRGLSVGSRNGALVSNVLAYKNGAAILPSGIAAVSASLPTSKIYIGARSDNTNAATLFRAATEGFVSAGADIPAGQQPAFYAAIQSFMTSVGANV